MKVSSPSHSLFVLITFFVLAVTPPSIDAQFVTGLQGTSGSAVGPDGALYVTEGAVGRISRIDPNTGDVSTFAEGLPQSLIGIGGAIDIEFIDNTAYVLVTLIGFPFSGQVDGVYRVDDSESFTVIADIGAWSFNNPPKTPFDLPNGVQYSLESFRGNLLVTDGHHNRVLLVTLDGMIHEYQSFENTVPTGLAVRGNTIYMAESGPVPHFPEDGKVLAFGPKLSDVSEVASGAMLAVDVELGQGQTMYVLSQGIWDGAFPGSPALPDTGALYEVDEQGNLTEVWAPLDRPTSVEFIGNSAFVITLTGEVWKMKKVSSPPHGKSR